MDGFRLPWSTMRRAPCRLPHAEPRTEPDRRYVGTAACLSAAGVLVAFAAVSMRHGPDNPARAQVFDRGEIVAAAPDAIGCGRIRQAMRFSFSTSPEAEPESRGVDEAPGCQIVSGDLLVLAQSRPEHMTRVRGAQGPVWVATSALTPAAEAPR